MAYLRIVDMKIFLIGLLCSGALCAPQGGTGAQAQPWGDCTSGQTCPDGYSCICKDASYSQCRQNGGSGWAPNSCWQCQSPGDKPNGYLQSTLSDSDVCNSSPGGGGGGGGNPGGNTGGGTGGGPGVVNQPSNTQPATSPSQSSGSGAGPQSGSPSGLTGSQSSPGDAQSLIAGYGSQTPIVGRCENLNAPPGWSIATTTYYNYMGTACLCGNGNLAQASWQSNTGPALGLAQGFYSGAVNNVLFRSKSQSGLTCGSSCGTCYDLVTSGTNAYNGGVGGGSMITLMVVDACYGTGSQERWCTGGPSSGPVQDSFGCTDHFDIQTDPTRSDVPATGMDGQTWSHGGQIVFYRPTPGGCPAAMTAAFMKDCKPNCDGRAV